MPTRRRRHTPHPLNTEQTLAAWRFVCSRGDVWFELYQQQGTLAQVKPCVVPNCGGLVRERAIVSLVWREMVA
jgi:hypothetical protein